MPQASQNDLDLARHLVLTWGWNTTCYQILNPGMSLWFSERKDAVVGYVLRGGNRVVAGAPVCHVERLPEILQEWHEDALKNGQGICYFGAEDRLRDHLQGVDGYQIVTLGAQPIWGPESFLAAFKTEKSLRYQLSRARNKQVRVEEWPSAHAANNPQLASVLHQWLATRGLPPMRFIVEPYTLDCLADRRLFVAKLRDEPVAFVILTPVPNRNGWLTEQFVRGEMAPNGTIELLLEAAVAAACESGSTFVSMGIVPLSERVRHLEGNNPRWLVWAMNWFRAHGRRFYNFDGLDRFKSKFKPDYWEPIYAISKEDEFSLSTLYSILDAFTQGPLATTFCQGLWRAARQEIRWALHGRGSSTINTCNRS